jgi:hypothetical protein
MVPELEGYRRLQRVVLFKVGESSWCIRGYFMELP